MDGILLILGFLLMIAGIAGSFVPILPGPPMSWLGLLLLYFTEAVAFNYWLLGITLALTVIITILDYVIPARGTKKFGGSKYGIWGTNIGLVVGIFAPVPFGFVIGPFLGALVGELIYNSTGRDTTGQSGTKRAFKAATGSFLGFIASAFVNFVFCVILFGIFIVVAWRNAAALF